tara:strand:+ start:3611 stop:3805 length:195 start_codon:yes stop_codon:yes gene_type:complete
MKTNSPKTNKHTHVNVELTRREIALVVSILDQEKYGKEANHISDSLWHQLQSGKTLSGNDLEVK